MKAPEVWFDGGWDWKEPETQIAEGPVRVLDDPDPAFEPRPVGF